MMQIAPNKWILIRDGEVTRIFNNRREAVRHFKLLLKQELSDFDKQDETDKFNYEIVKPSIVIKPIEEREAYLGL